MDPKFICPFCGKERRYLMASQSVTVKGSIYFRAIDFHLALNHTFCNSECLFDYIAQHEEEYAD